jgi:hypothetical protein
VEHVAAWLHGGDHDTRVLLGQGGGPRFQGATYFLLQFCVLVYLVISIVLTGGYLKSESPKISLTAWDHALPPRIEAGSHPACSCHDFPDSAACGAYEAHFPMSPPFVNVGCVAAPEGEAITSSTSTTFIATAMQVCPAQYCYCLDVSPPFFHHHLHCCGSRGIGVHIRSCDGATFALKRGHAWQRHILSIVAGAVILWCPSIEQGRLSQLCGWSLA